MLRGSVYVGLRIGSLPFLDNVVLLLSSQRKLQLLLGQFAAKYEVAVMKISTSKYETILSLVEEFNFLVVLS